MSFWRKDEPELDGDGTVIKGGMWKPQLKWWNSQSFIKAFVAGYGGGKTFISAKRAISLALHNNGSPHLYVSPSYKIAKRTIRPALIELLEGRHIPYKENKTDHEFRLKYRGHNGVIWIGSGDEPDSLKGPNIGSANIDEPFIQAKAVIDQVLARVRDPKARHREIGLTGTPEELNWGYDICAGDEKHKYDVDLIQASTLENKALPGDFVDRLTSAYDERTASAYVKGQFVNLNAGAVYYNFDADLNSTAMEINEDRVIMVGMDFNVDPMSATLSHDIDGMIYACEEVVIQNSNTEMLCKAIIERYPRGRFIVYPDSTGKSRTSKGVTDFAIIADVFKGQLDGLEYPRKNPHLRDRFNTVNSMMCNTKGERKAFVNKAGCPELTKDLQQVTFPYDDYKRKNPKRTHFSDNWGYNISRAYPFGTRPEIIVS